LHASNVDGGWEAETSYFGW